MKKILLFIGLFFVPFIALANSYTAGDLTVNYEESKWIVFTRENIKGNAKLKELGIDETQLKELYEKGFIYVDALLDSSDLANSLESFVLIKDVEDSVKNLHTYSNSKIKEVENEIIKGYNTTDHGIYEAGKYKYVYMTYKDQGLNIYDYYTTINGKGYTLKFQKTSNFTSDELSLMKTVLNGVTFKLDEKYEKKDGFDWSRVLTYAIVGGVVGGLSALGGIISNKKKKQQPTQDIPNSQNPQF